ncbi:hypothetical protein B4U80_07045 [Leptotrombidium deliense]|uniref:Oligomycin sensitivity conferral protein n=1 Tax=Leptotrombidium deliense TaxID=299467 RepID=A0A443SV07_9ACAR|nr:hypothetical protein B4U80_07045 [Leptotrombidium deliense]
MAKALGVARNYATQAAASKLVKPPIDLFGIEGRYTNALYSAAHKTKNLEAVETDLKKLGKGLESDPKFRDFVMNPLINVNQKKKMLSEMLSSKMKVNELTINLLGVLAENGKLKYLPNIARAYAKVMAASRGEVNCVVISAKPITDENQRKELESALKGFTKKKLNVEMKVDPTIIGGLVIDFGGEHYVDLSIKSKLKMYTDLIKMPV